MTASAAISTRPSTLLDRPLDSVENKTVTFEQRVFLARVDPPSVEHLVTNPVALFEQPLDGVGDLEFAALGRLDRARRGEDRRVEQIDPDQGQVRGRVLRLLDQFLYLAGSVDSRDAERRGVIDLGQQDLGDQLVGLFAELRFVGGLSRRLKARDKLLKTLFEHVVAEIHDEVVVAKELLGYQYTVSQPERLGLRDVGDIDPEV